MINLQDKNELDRQEKVADIMDILQRVSKPLLVVLAMVLVLAMPLQVILRVTFTSLFYSVYNPPAIIYEFPKPKDLQIVEKKFFSSGPNAYFAYARISNPNTDLAVRKLNFNFNLLGAGNQVLATSSTTTYILPGQDKVVFMSPVTLSTPPSAVELKLEKPKSWSKFPGMQSLNFIFEQVGFGKDMASGFYVSALMKNDTSYIIPEVELAILLYDSKNEVVGVNFTTLNLLLPRENRFFRMIWPNGVNGAVAHVEFKPVVNQLKPGSLQSERAELDDYFNAQ